MQYVKLLYKLLSRNLIEIVEEKNRVKSWRGGLYTGQFEKWIQLFMQRFEWGGICTGFELTYRDSGNAIHFSFFTTQFFPLRLKITIPKDNIKKKKNCFFFNREIKLILLLTLETISIAGCHVLWEQLFLHIH